MDAVYYTALRLLEKCTFLPGSFEKRFVRDCASLAEDAPLSDKQIGFLKLLTYKYRQQIARHDPDFYLDWTWDEPRVAALMYNRAHRREKRNTVDLSAKYGTPTPKSIKDWWTK